MGLLGGGMQAISSYGHVIGTLTRLIASDFDVENLCYMGSFKKYFICSGNRLDG